MAHDIDLGEREIAMVFDATISTPDANVEAKIYSFPDVEEFVAMLNDMSVGVDSTPSAVATRLSVDPSPGSVPGVRTVTLAASRASE